MKLEVKAGGESAAAPYSGSVYVAYRGLLGKLLDKRYLVLVATFAVLAAGGFVGSKLVREMFPINSYRSQAPARLHFGLGDTSKIKSLSIRWPSGKVQEFLDLEGNRHVVITEGADEVAVSD